MSHVVAYGQLAERVVKRLDAMEFARTHGGEVTEDRLPHVIESLGNGSPADRSSPMRRRRLSRWRRR